MKIEQQFPFDHCESCPNTVLDVTYENLYGDDHIVSRVIRVRCENEALCKKLQRRLDDVHEKNVTGQVRCSVP